MRYFTLTTVTEERDFKPCDDLLELARRDLFKVLSRTAECDVRGPMHAAVVMSGSASRPKATSLLLARRFWYGGAETRVGTPSTSDNSPEPTQADIDRAEGIAGRLADRAAAPGAYDELRCWLAYYHAAERSISARRDQFEEAARLARQTLGEVYARGGLTPEQDELLRLRAAGLLNSPLCLPYGPEQFVSMSPVTDAGEQHNDLLGYAASLLRDALARGTKRDRGFKPRLDKALAETLGYDGEWVRQRGSMFKSGLRIESIRRHPLFALTPTELLTAEVPVNPLDFDPLPHMQPLNHFLPGFVSTVRTERLPPPEAFPHRPGSSAYYHVPAMMIPWLEGWHRLLHGPKQRGISIPHAAPPLAE